MILAGFDEAGYGPRLGPLVVAWTAFEVEERRGREDDPDPRGVPSRGGPATEPARGDLWRLLTRAVRREARGPAHKVWVADSKAVKPRKDGLKQLELGVLSFLASSGGLPRTLPELLLRLGEQPSPCRATAWYGSLGRQRLPAHAWPGEVQARAERIRDVGAERGVALVGTGARVVPARRFNERLAATRNKATVLGEAFVDLLQSLRGQREGPLHVTVDRHGGRTGYARLLGQAFPMCPIEIFEEGGEVSAYRVDAPQGPVDLLFRSEAELGSLPVALASMTAKYLRELFMGELNAWFRERVPGLAPTAGYAKDATRFLADVEEHLPSLGVPRDVLVRAR